MTLSFFACSWYISHTTWSKDRNALQSAVDQIEAGRAVGIFPEGTHSRTGILGRARSGTTRNLHADTRSCGTSSRDE